MHSYIESICVDLGNMNNFDTFTADPSAIYEKKFKLADIATLKKIPVFTYDEIIKSASKIDVVWFNKQGYVFPKHAFEVVDSINTLTNAFERTLQLTDFDTKFHIIGRKEYIKQFNDKLAKKPFNEITNRYI